MANNEDKYCIIDMSSDLMKQGAVDRKPVFLCGLKILQFTLYIFIPFECVSEVPVQALLLPFGQWSLENAAAPSDNDWEKNELICVEIDKFLLM